MNLDLSLATKLGVCGACKEGCTTTRQQFGFRRSIGMFAEFLRMLSHQRPDGRIMRIQILSGMSSSVLY
jgi:hypothetical protein